MHHKCNSAVSVSGLIRLTRRCQRVRITEDTHSYDTATILFFGIKWYIMQKKKPKFKLLARHKLGAAPFFPIY